MGSTPADAAIIGGEAGLSAPLGWTGQIAGTAGNWVYAPGLDPLAGTYGVDPALFILPPSVILFTADDIPNTLGHGILGGFGFSSPFAAGDGPTTIRTVFVGDEGPQEVILTLDPKYPATPNSPHGIPEPLSAGLSLLGVGALCGYLRRRR